MVTFGMEPRRRAQAMTISALMHAVFICACTAIVYVSRHAIAAFYREPGLAETLELFPLVAMGFLLRNYFLKVSQLDIDIRSMFFIDAAWAVATAVLVAFGWMQGTLVNADDMMIISAVAAGLPCVSESRSVLRRQRSSCRRRAISFCSRDSQQCRA
jgi:hypothetical protein